MNDELERTWKKAVMALLRGTILHTWLKELTETLVRTVSVLAKTET
jgi:hypothetical protein